MGRRGPKPRPKHPKSDPLAGPPDKPTWLDETAAEKWDELVEMLDERHVITQADRTALALLCQTYAQWRAAADELRKTSVAAETEAGMPKQSPETLAVNQLAGRLLVWLREFGLTPASRDRVEPVVSVASDEADPWRGILKVPR
jgi:P27 family predicted phage terminase small subunit